MHDISYDFTKTKRHFVKVSTKLKNKLTVLSQIMLANRVKNVNVHFVHVHNDPTT